MISREEIGRKGGQAALHSKHVSAAQLAMYLKGCGFPLNKTSLCDCVKSNDAPRQVLSVINRLPEREYAMPTDVEREFGKIK